MKEKIFLAILFISVLISLVSADWSSEAICGNGVCEAGYLLSPDNTPEDISTCFIDCLFTDWVQCTVDSISGGNCIFNGQTFKFSNLIRNSCGISSDVSLGFTAEYNGHTMNILGLAPYYYSLLFDDVSVSAGAWPCAVSTTEQTIYLKRSLDKAKFNNFMQVLTSNIDLRSDNRLLINFDFKGLAGPYKNVVIINNQTQEVLVSINGGGFSNFSTDLDPLAINPGIYAADAKLFDNTGANLIAQQSSKITINECLVDKECDDGKFWTKDICSGNEYKVCLNPIKYILVGSLVVIILAVIIFLLFMSRIENRIL